MTVASEMSSVSYSGDGSTQVFSIPYYFLKNADIVVVLRDADGNETIKTLTTDYTLSGAADEDGGSCTMLSAPASGTTLLIYRDPEAVQNTDYVPNDDFPAASHEEALDLLTMLIQRSRELIDKCVVLPITSALSNIKLPEPGADKFLKWNSDGTALETAVVQAGASVTDATETLKGIAEVATQTETNAGTDDTKIVTPKKLIACAATEAQAGVAKVATSTQTSTGTDDATIVTPKKLAGIFGAMVKQLIFTSGGISTSGNPPITATFRGSELDANMWQNVTGTAASDTTPEIGAQFSLQASGGFTDQATNYKIALTASTKATVHAGDLYGLNTIVEGLSGPSGNVLMGVESDVNNKGADSDDFGSHSAYGFYAAGDATARCTSAFHATGFGQWNYGFSVNASVNSNAFHDESTSVNGLHIEGSKTTAIDLTGVSATFGLALPNNLPISAADTGGDIRALLSLDSTNRVHLGFSSSLNISAETHLLPSTDDTYNIGGGVNRWAAVFAANGTIQTSDPAQKTDIAELPESLSLVNAIKPRTFKWVSGGKVPRPCKKKIKVQATEEVDGIEIVKEIRDGKCIAIERSVKRQNPLWDFYPVVDTHGQPVTQQIGRKQIQQMHVLPRMVEQEVDDVEYVDRPGRRTHWGFLAPEVKAAIEKTGLDFGGYVLTEEGTHALRPDQLIPILWKAVQELSAKVAALEAK